MENSPNPALRLPALSITKTLAALAAVRAVGEGWLSPDRPLTDVIPEWRAHPAKSRTTLRMLLNQTAGFSSGAAELYRGRIRDKGRIAIALPMLDSPGTRFRYGPASSEILVEVMRRQLAKQGSTPEALMRDLMRRIGINSTGWRTDVGGRIYFSTGAILNVRDLGRLGQVVAELAQGDNAAGLMAAVFRNLAAPRPANPMFSAGMWWNRNSTNPGANPVEPERVLDGARPPSFWERACLHPAIAPSWIAMVGSGGKRVYVLPPQGLVIVRMGRAGGWNDGAFLRAVSA